jgi:hypothetical protein
LEAQPILQFNLEQGDEKQQDWRQCYQGCRPVFACTLQQRDKEQDAKHAIANRNHLHYE